MINILKVTLLSLVEGFTEFLPISSTGHMMIVNNYLNLSSHKEFVDAFYIIIQLGAILSVVVYFFNDLFPFIGNVKEKINMWLKIVVAVIPSAIIGLLFDDYITDKFFNIKTVSITLFIYGIILILIENIMKKRDNKIDKITNVSYKKAVMIGLFQCLALIPGTSRSLATILGGISLGLNRVLATTFSFFLAIPTMFGASLLKILKIGNSISNEEWLLIALGFILSFIFSYIFIQFLMNYIKKYDFKIFGYYRIILAIILLIIN